MIITAKATRSGDWWAIEFTSPAGPRFTQARRLDQVEALARDICNMDGVQVDAVEVVPQTTGAEAGAVGEYLQAAAEASAAAERASLASRRAVTVLRGEGLSVRDIAALMGISPQRVSQLAS